MSTASATDLARLDRLPRWPWSNALLGSLGGSFFFAFFDIVVIGAALPSIIADFDVSASSAAWAVTASLLGLVVGEFLGATLATRKGRVFTLRTALWVFSAGMILSAFTQDRSTIRLESTLVAQAPNHGVGMHAGVFAMARAGSIRSLKLRCGLLRARGVGGRGREESGIDTRGVGCGGQDFLMLEPGRRFYLSRMSHFLR